MDKLHMQTPNLADENFAKLQALFPNAVTEVISGYDENGKPIVTRAIDKDVLMQEISAEVVDGPRERYQFTWPDKKKSVLLANAPIQKTLRPVRNDEATPTGEDSSGKPYCSTGSVDFDHTENLYIEGDNLDVLKLLRETYLGKIKMIYIDPPYNTGNDFVYEDDFAESMADYAAQSGDYDEAGNRLVKNLDSNGRFHTDWLNMIYPRLKLARDLLTDDGVIFISIDDNEQTNLVKICDEVFGSTNRIGPLIQNKQNAKNDTINVQKNHEFIIAYRKTIIFDGTTIKPSLIRTVIMYKDVIEEDGEFFYLNDPITTRGEGGTLNARPNLGYTVYYNPSTKDIIGVSDYDITCAKQSNNEREVYSDNIELLEKGYVAIRPPKVRGKLGCWTWELSKFNAQKRNIIITGKPGAYSVRKRTFVDKSAIVIKDGKRQFGVVSNVNSRSILDFSTNDGTTLLNSIMEKGIFNNPKNIDMLTYFISLLKDDSLTVLDFFSGSATTAHAVMQLNAEDGGKRKFIMVQLPEETDKNSEAFKAGYKNICEIGKERIRRAGAKIKEGLRHDANTRLGDHKADDDQMILWSHGETKINGVTREDLTYSNENDEMKKRETHSPQAEKDRYYYNPDLLDTGFRVLKLDSTNMKPVYYTPDAYTPSLFDSLTDNIKEDRTPEDLLFQVMLERGVLLSSKIEEKTIGGKRVFFVAGNYLVACFDSDLDEATITAIAKTEPYYFVTRESAFSSDSAKTNCEQLFKTYSPTTEWWVM